MAALFEEYEKALRSANALDFDDLLLEAVRLLRHDDATREAWNRRLSYVMIDEYQDTNRSQYELMRLLSEQHDNVCVVGDEDQSIYSWRGADIRNILDFERDFPNARTIRLEQNYRSTKNILAAAGAVVENNKARKGKKLWTEADGRRDDRPLCRATTPRTRRCSSPTPSRSTCVANPDDHVAVLYRTNSQSRQIEEALRRYGRKYNVVGGFSFYQRAEIKDVVAYLKLGGVHRRFGEPAAHHQYAGARHRPHHGGADREVRARARTRACGTRSSAACVRRAGQCRHAVAIGAGDVPQPDSGEFAGGAVRRRCPI